MKDSNNIEIRTLEQALSEKEIMERQMKENANSGYNMGRNFIGRWYDLLDLIDDLKEKK